MNNCCVKWKKKKIAKNFQNDSYDKKNHFDGQKKKN
jgi:hypothetical protein